MVGEEIATFGGPKTSIKPNDGNSVAYQDGIILQDILEAEEVMSPIEPKTRKPRPPPFFIKGLYLEVV